MVLGLTQRVFSPGIFLPPEKQEYDLEYKGRHACRSKDCLCLSCISLASYVRLITRPQFHKASTEAVIDITVYFYNPILSVCATLIERVIDILPPSISLRTYVFRVSRSLRTYA